MMVTWLVDVRRPPSSWLSELQRGVSNVQPSPVWMGSHHWTENLLSRTCTTNSSNNGGTSKSHYRQCQQHGLKFGAQQWLKGGLTVMNCLKMIVIICRLNDRGISMMHHDITFVATVNGLTVHWGAGQRVARHLSARRWCRLVWRRVAKMASLDGQKHRHAGTTTTSVQFCGKQFTRNSWLESQFRN